MKGSEGHLEPFGLALKPRTQVDGHVISALKWCKHAGLGEVNG